MQKQSIDLNEIRRPKLIMSAAKELVLSRKQHGVSSKRKNIQTIAAKEYEYEEMRITRSVNYSANTHICLLADIIEYIRERQIVAEAV